MCLWELRIKQRALLVSWSLSKNHDQLKKCPRIHMICAIPACTAVWLDRAGLLAREAARALQGTVPMRLHELTRSTTLHPDVRIESMQIKVNAAVVRAV